MRAWQQPEGERDSSGGAAGRSEIRIPGTLVARIAVTAGVCVLGLAAVGLIAEWLWFDSLALASVFITTIVTRFTLFLVAGLLFFALFVVNVVTTRHLAYKLDSQAHAEAPNAAWEVFLAQVGIEGAVRSATPRAVNGAVLGVGDCWPSSSAS